MEHARTAYFAGFNASVQLRMTLIGDRELLAELEALDYLLGTSRFSSSVQFCTTTRFCVLPA